MTLFIVCKSVKTCHVKINIQMICILSILKSVLTAVHTQWRWSAPCTYTSLVPSGPQTRQKGRSSVLLTAPGERFQNMHCTSTSIELAVFVTRIKTSGQESCLKHTVTHQGTEAVFSQMKWTQQDSAVVTSHFYSVKSRLKKIHKGREAKLPSFQPFVLVHTAVLYMQYQTGEKFRRDNS